MSLPESYLALDASTEKCSVTLVVEGRFHSRECNIPRSHAKVMLPLIQELLNEHGMTLRELSKIVVSRGPGSFTGIRICLSIAQGLAYGSGLPIVSVDSLAALAKYASIAATPHPGLHSILSSSPSRLLIIPALDARMNEIYWSANILENNLIKHISEPTLSSPVDFVAEVSAIISQQAANTPFVGVGHGWEVVTDQIDIIQTKCSAATAFDASILPHAEGAARLVLDEKFGEVSEDGVIEPLYIRNEVAWEKRKRIRPAPQTAPQKDS
ncbi:tRNA threonylcarbamoyladenosine biosynthesis protein TsaB [Thalassocella blandensis]|nr:tRNA threonylcarbamoyladenosine biosynthesis protein TsaB [Thalassocella blandensis]